MARYTPSGNISRVSQLDSELEKISDAIEDTLSRQGDTPNQMHSSLDMNSERIINVAAPESPSDAARLQDVVTTITSVSGETFYLESTADILNHNITTDFIRTEGCYAAGDDGAAVWKATGRTIAPRQWFSDTGTARLSTASGREYEYQPLSGLSRKEIYVRALGARGGFVEDDTAALKAAVAWVSESGTNRSTGGGVVLLGEISLHLGETLLIEEHNVTIKGIGGGGFQSGIGGIRDSAASRIRWEGPAEGAVIHFHRPPEGQIKLQGGLEDLMIDCFNTARDGLRLTSWERATFRNISIYGPTFAAIRLVCHENGTGPAPFDCYRNVFENVFTSCKNLAGNTAVAVLLEGKGFVNSCFNRFHNCWLDMGEANDEEFIGSVIMRDTDNNYFEGCVTPHIIFSSGDDGGGSPARFNWVHNSEVRYITAKASQIGGASSFNNLVTGANNSNGAGNLIYQPGMGGAPDGQMLVYDTYGFQGRWEHDVTRYVPRSTPSNPKAGDVYYDSSTNKLRCYNGTSWNNLF